MDWTISGISEGIKNDDKLGKRGGRGGNQYGKRITRDTKQLKSKKQQIE